MMVFRPTVSLTITVDSPRGARPNNVSGVLQSGLSNGSAFAAGLSIEPFSSCRGIDGLKRSRSLTSSNGQFVGFRSRLSLGANACTRCAHPSA